MLSTLLAVLLLGRLCIGDACSETTDATIAVKPADRERRFFWLSADAKTAYAGVIAPKVESVVLDPETYSALDTTIEGEATRGWPLDVKLSLGVAPEQQWTFELDRDEAKRLRRLYVPLGKYLVTATTEHHRILRTTVSAKADPQKLELRFVPLPVARGVVVDMEDRAIAAASITLPDTTVCATADLRGEFTCELPEKIPEALVVSSIGYSPREARISRHELRDVAELGRIQLSPGRRLTVTAVRSEPMPVRVTLLMDVPRYEHSKVKTISLSEEEETARFDVGEGKYYVVAEGDGPLERLAVPVTVKDLDVEEQIRVEPFQLSGSVHFGGEPLKDGQIEVTAPNHAWRIPLPIAGGAFTATMWQKGVVNGWVTSPELGPIDPFSSPELGEDPSQWDIRIEKRMIAGRVFDAVTKAPVTETSFEVVADSGNSQFYFPAEIQADGSYRIIANRPGTYTLQVESPKYMPHKAVLRITADDRTRTHDIALESGVLQPIDVVTPAGMPMTNVGVVEDVKPQLKTRVDERGHYEVRGLPDTSLLLWFVADQGSFAMARMRLPRTNAEVRPMQVVIPPPCCTLRIRGLTLSEVPISARLLVRYNGEFLPPHNVVRAQREGDVVLRSLPAGTYEIWAIGSEEDRQRLLFSNGSSREPVRVGLSGGEQAVTVVVPLREAPRR